MEVKKMNENSPASSNSSSSSSATSSNFTFEGDFLPIDLPHNWFASQIEQITQKIQDLLPQHNAAVVCLQQVFDEVNLLQDENLNLKALTINLEFLVSAAEREILSEISCPIPAGVNQVSDEKTTTDPVPRGGVVPKISVRSKTVSAMNKIINNQAVVGDSNSSNAPATTGSKPLHRLRLTAKSSKDGEQGEEIELEVYKQGMTKTELCKNWEETGECPYGDRCQFAHGVKELRPVIRHPKYKTTICRMITNGGTCPYGHRCHFRHAIDPNEEKEVVL
ncbi:hypothetical protein ACHQM5_012409 [Ranunculus cassubicifolius]